MPPRKTAPSDFDVAMQAAAAAVDEGTSDEGPALAPDLTSAAAQVFGDMTIRGLHDKLVAIMRAVPNDLAPSGWNEKQRYAYWEISQITGLVRGLFSRYGITFVPHILSFDIRERKTKDGGASMLTTILVEFTLTDTDTGETLVRTAIGQGDDPGDKGSNKALTGAVKNWLMRLLLLGGEDAEAFEDTDTRYEPVAAPRGSSRRTRDRGDAPDVVIEGSNIQGIERGGRSTKATDLHVKTVRRLAKELGWDAYTVADTMNASLGTEIVLPDEDPGPALLKELGDLGADPIGELIQIMKEAKDERDTEPEEPPTGDSYA